MSPIKAKVPNHTPLIGGTHSLTPPQARPIRKLLAADRARPSQSTSGVAVEKSSKQRGKGSLRDVMIPAFDRRYFLKYASTLAAMLLPVGALLPGCRKPSPVEGVTNNPRRPQRWKKPTLFALNKGQRFIDAFGGRAKRTVTVFVYPEQDAMDAPYAPSLSHHPVRGLRAGQPVTIRYFGDNVDRNMSLDFGDGSRETIRKRGSGTVTHSYQKSGTYTLTYRGEGPGGIGTFKRQIIVGKES